MREAGGGRNDLNLRRKLSFHLPPAPTSVGACPLPLGSAARPRTTGFVEDWWRTEDYDRRRRSIANALKPMARSERAEGSGTEVIVELMASFAVVAAANPDNFRAPAA